MLVILIFYLLCKAPPFTLPKCLYSKLQRIPSGFKVEFTGKKGKLRTSLSGISMLLLGLEIKVQGYPGNRAEHGCPNPPHGALCSHVFRSILCQSAWKLCQVHFFLFGIGHASIPCSLPASAGGRQCGPWVSSSRGKHLTLTAWAGCTSIPFSSPVSSGIQHGPVSIFLFILLSFGEPFGKGLASR